MFFLPPPLFGRSAGTNKQPFRSVPRAVVVYAKLVCITRNDIDDFVVRVVARAAALAYSEREIFLPPVFRSVPKLVTARRLGGVRFFNRRVVRKPISSFAVRFRN